MKPSSEIKMHLKVYEKRNDIKSVVHAHPIYATIFSTIGKTLSSKIIAEAVVQFGEVPVAQYALPSSEEVPASIECFLQKYEVVLLQNHGALSWGHNLESAYLKMESLEFYSKVLYKAQLIGGVNEINEQEVNRLYELRRKLNLPGVHPFVE